MDQKYHLKKWYYSEIDEQKCEKLESFRVALTNHVNIFELGYSNAYGKVFPYDA